MSFSPYGLSICFIAYAHLLQYYRQVNLASRLESLGKYYGASILISGQLRDAVGDTFLARPVDRIVAYGRQAPTEVNLDVGLGPRVRLDVASPILMVYSVFFRNVCSIVSFRGYQS